MHIPYLLDLPLTPLEWAERMPDCRMGSWHALEKTIVCQLTQFFTGPLAGTLDPKGLTRAQKAHNKKVRWVVFLLGLLNGLRTFEVPQLLPQHFSPETHSLLVSGRGQHLRQIPLHPWLTGMIADLAGKREPHKPEYLFWIYNKKGNTMHLTAHRMDTFFGNACEAIGQPRLDFYSLRHRFRTDLHDLGVRDEVINYLMGHLRRDIGNFTLRGLDDHVRAIYLESVELNLKNYNLLERMT